MNRNMAVLEFILWLTFLLMFAVVIVYALTAHEDRRREPRRRLSDTEIERLQKTWEDAWRGDPNTKWEPDDDDPLYKKG